MRKLFICVALLMLGLIIHGCSHEETLDPSSVAKDDEIMIMDGEKCGGWDLYPGKYYSFFFNNDVGSYSDLSWINRRNGYATFVWQAQFQLYGDGDFPVGWIPFGLAFDVDGTMYTTENVISFESSEVLSRFVRMDSATGEVFPVSDVTVPFNTSGPDIDACGNFYVCGFQVDALGYIWGNDSLWRVDKETGEFIEVGPTGHTNWMDLAFDSDGTLWGTFDNELYVIDTETGASTFVTEIHGVPLAGEPYFMEVMSIAFDRRDRLYGTGLTTLYDHPDGSPVMRINVNTGEATFLGNSETPNSPNHGGDIMPSRVRIAHRKGNGSFVCRTVSMWSLPWHLAHGDYVPGAAGYDCDDCPEGNHGYDDEEDLFDPDRD